MKTKLNPVWFWDMDFEALDCDRDKQIIIERVFNNGDIEDVKQIIKFYGEKVIREEIRKAGFLDKKTLNFVSLLFDIPKEEFSCFLKMQSSPEYWNF